MSDSPLSRPHGGRPLKVIIVGGGIAGLTLASALEKAPVPIEYVILEAGDTIAPQVGAGIALAPGGCRILDQLGVYDDLEQLVYPVQSSGVSDRQGKQLLPERSDTALVVTARMSYPLGWVERRSVLQALFKYISRKSCVLTSKRMDRIEHSLDQEKPVKVICTDGSCYEGDLVVGADGVHSKTRSEMWKAVEQNICGNFDVQKERRTMTAEYQCMFGISTPIPGLDPGMTDDTFAKDVSMVVASGKGGKIFWFLFKRMPWLYQSQEIPRFDTTDASRFAEQYFDLPVRPGVNGVTLQDLWKRRETVTLVPLEEADFAHWTAGRIACLGDSAHKMTPHTGTGGMLAIEHAAVLANIAYQLAVKGNKSSLTTSQIETALSKYDDERAHRRTSAKIKTTGEVARMQTLQTVVHRLVVRFLLPYLGDIRADQFCDDAVGAEHIDYIPIPVRSMTGLMPFDPTRGIGMQKSLWPRVLWAIPLLIMAVAGFLSMFSVAPIEDVYDTLAHLTYREVAIQDKFYNVSFLDDFSRSGVLRFIVSEAHFFYQSFSLFADYGVWYGIMLIESARRAHRLNILSCAILWGMLNMWGIGIFVPVYYFAYYILTPTSTFDAFDRRLTDLSYTKSILPVLLATHYATFIDAYFSPVMAHRQGAGYLWELFPVWLCLAQAGLARFILPSTLKQDRLDNVTRDLPTIRTIILGLCAVSTAVWQYTIWCSGESLVNIFVPIFGSVEGHTFEQLFAEFLKWDQVFFAIPNVFWIGLLFADLRAAGLIHTGWLKIILSALGLTIIGGNGTMLGMMWLYREEILATRRHRTAVVQKSD
ncbi:uncharacterized protein N7479_010495 [Penicillium vulpinum]|uniref:FAD-binding domain-containing protein n=1 Tax=Penicillium vulpinum TaxID=29845 RepID=A0A1V6S962_9EURO|nr:uncharacterized protein N7479_010495 [Penicillium vulpinum]KAJ5952082.1 hypothetical protein N7479_010495 [Penicillium vulpinum]OQE10398.1 hypothetical protein PENVUL_c004G00149 [Penicillium vulpinum]